MKRRIPLIASSVILFLATLASGFYIGGQYAQLRFDQQDREIKELTLSHLESDGMLRGNSFVAFDPIDRRDGTIAVTGVLRTTEPDRTRVGRFWVEFDISDGNWSPRTVQAMTIPESNSEPIRWP